MKFIHAFLFALAVSLVACSPKIYPLKGSYPQTPIVRFSDNSFDKVWEKTIDFFAENGIPIRIIDKSSGLIISDKANLTWSFEDKNGKLVNPMAFVAIPSVMDQDKFKPYRPESVTGEWNVRIKAVEGKASINVNLYNITATFGRSYYSTFTHSIVEPVKLDGRTTGVFEKKISDAVK